MTGMIGSNTDKKLKPKKVDDYQGQNRPPMMGQSRISLQVILFFLILDSPFTRSQESKMELRTYMVRLEVAQYSPESQLASRFVLSIQDFEVIDNIKTSLWRKFMAFLRPGPKELPREQGSNMVVFEMVKVRPNPKLDNQEVRLKVNKKGVIV
jgi:hypothetical protein